MGLKKLFLKTSAVNTATAATNMLSTVLLVRWFSAGVYADFLVDLAYISLASILLEIVPSSYSVFRVQDDPSRVRGLAALAIVTAIILAIVAGVFGNVFILFHAYSGWIVLYAGSLAIKRYLDIRLQSTGRLSEYLGIELRGAIIRIVLMGGFFWWEIKPVDAVWASLASATLVTQLLWFIKNSDERQFFCSINDKLAWLSLWTERKFYAPYYLGIALKRLRDNLVPILASKFFINRELLGTFFLAYRGLLFTLGQIRVIEGLLNHRHTLATVLNLPIFHKVIVAISSQILCVSASFFLIFLSGVYNYNVYTILILSIVVWIYVFSMLERIKAYSNYNPSIVNFAMFSYCITGVILVFISIVYGSTNEITFSSILVFCELISFFVFRILLKYKDKLK